MDTRAQRTRHALAKALIRLAPEKGFDVLSVEELARGAGVARSTFYAHYAGKDDFLDRSYTAMMRAMDESARASGRRAILPALELFTHVKDARAYVLSMTESGAFDALMARREEFLAELAAANLERFHPDQEAAERRVASIMVAGAFIALLRWWIARGFEPSPAAMADWFDRFAEGAAKQNAPL
ncbi:MAG: TetR/AcrR family transcriptional regulator [Hyphomonadaceae bacterium]